MLPNIDFQAKLFIGGVYQFYKLYYVYNACLLNFLYLNTTGYRFNVDGEHCKLLLGVFSFVEYDC